MPKTFQDLTYMVNMNLDMKRSQAPDKSLQRWVLPQGRVLEDGNMRFSIELFPGKAGGKLRDTIVFLLDFR